MNLLFYIFSSFALVSGIMVIRARNPVYSVLFLILVFFNCAGLLLFLGLDFFALIFLVVYVGAIAVLFLFVVMMLSISLVEVAEKKARYLPIGGALVFLFLLEIFLIYDNDLRHLTPNLVVSALSFSAVSSEIGQLGSQGAPFGQQLQTVDHLRSEDQSLLEGSVVEWSHLLSTSTNIEAIGMCIYTYFFVFFGLASIILLVAMIGAIVLTMSKQASVKRQKVFQQNTREFAQTVSRFS